MEQRHGAAVSNRRKGGLGGRSPPLRFRRSLDSVDLFKSIARNTVGKPIDLQTFQLEKPGPS